MSGAMERRAKHEAAFKFVHSRIRLHAETVALYAAEAFEQAEVRRSFDAVTESSKNFIAWQSLFQSLQVLFQYVPFLVSGVRILTKRQLALKSSLHHPPLQYTSQSRTSWTLHLTINLVF